MSWRNTPIYRVAYGSGQLIPGEFRTRDDALRAAFHLRHSWEDAGEDKHFVVLLGGRHVGSTREDGDPGDRTDFWRGR